MEGYMNKFIGGSQNGQDFPLDSDKYQGITFKAGDIKKNESTTYRRHELDEHTFWVDEALSDEDVQVRIKKLLENQ